MSGILAASAAPHRADYRSHDGGIDHVLYSHHWGVWARADLYPRTGDGLPACYVAALPFFHNAVFGDMFYGALLFGALALIMKGWPVVREPEFGSAR